MEEDSSRTFKFEAGKYWVGDPCYAIDRWEEVGKATGWFGSDDDNPAAKTFTGEFEYNGRRCFAWNTAYGDGEYKGSDGFSYGVDAGLIGILPVEAVDDPEVKDLGNVMTFDSQFTVRCIDGVFTFGRLMINTREDEDDDADDREIRW